MREMRAASAWAIAHLRRRWAMLVLLGLIPGVAGAATLTAVAGARRAATSYERAHEAARGPDAAIATDFDPALWRIDALEPFFESELVEDRAVVVPFAMRPVGTDLYLIFDIEVIGAADERFATAVSRFRIVEGRTYDHAQADEAVISTDYAQRFGVGVGDVLRFESWTQEALNASVEANFTRPPPDGPTVEVTVVGIARVFGQIVPTSTPGTVHLTAAFTRQHLSEIGISLP